MNFPITEGAIEAYERLRFHLLELSGQNGSNPERVILLRRGMLTWTQERNHLMASTAAPVFTPISPAVGSPSSGELATELVRLMASLILSGSEGALLCQN